MKLGQRLNRRALRNRKTDPLESTIENAYVDFARGLGVLAIKFKDDKRRNAPDRLNLCPGMHTFFIEFKKRGEKPRRGQILYHDMLRNMGYAVYVCDTLDQAKHVLAKELGHQ